MIIDILTWWQNLPGVEQVFCTIGVVSNLLFAVYIGIQLLGHDTDVPAHADLDHGDLNFTIWSVRSILAFGMFSGYTGFAALQTGLSLVVAVIIGILAGVLAAWLAYRLVRLLLRLQSSGTMQLENAVGATGTVHLTLPAGAVAPGRVMIVFQGALRELEAVSEGDDIPTGTSILVTQVLDNGRLVVVPYTE